MVQCGILFKAVHAELKENIEVIPNSDTAFKSSKLLELIRQPLSLCEPRNL